MESVALHEPSNGRRGVSTTPALPSAGSVVGRRYQLGQVLTEGVATVVYSALHLDLGQPVAMKTLRPEHVSDPGLVECFLDDARRLASVVSPLVGRVIDVGLLPGGAPFAVMDAPRGESIGRVLESRGRLDVSLAIDFVIQASKAVSRIHAAGMVHGDVKPTNLFVTVEPDGSVSLKLFSLGVPPSCFGKSTILGSPAYMAPEQVAHAPDIDQRADVWALGVLLFELLTGRTPFRGDSSAEVFAEVLGQPPPSLTRLCKDADRELESIVLRALEKDPKNRFPNASAFADSLRARADPVNGADDALAGNEAGRASHLVLLGMAAAACAAALLLLALTLGSDAWRRFAPGSTLESSSPAPPMLDLSAEPARGVYATHPSRDDGGNPALRAEPEATSRVRTLPGGGETHAEYLDRQGMTSVEEVVVKERRYYDREGKLIGVETRLFDPSTANAAKE